MMIKFHKIFLCLSLLFFNTNFVFSGINFSNRKSKVSINNNANFINSSGNAISGWTGTFATKTGGGFSGNDILFEGGVFDEEGTGLFLTGYFRPEQNRLLGLTRDNDFVRINSGTFLNSLFINASGTRIEGQPVFNTSWPILLWDSNSEVTLAVQSNLNTDIELNGGKVNLDNDLRFVNGNNFITSGTVNLQGYGLYFGSGDLNLTHTIQWQNATDINLTGKTDFSGLWTFTGAGIINGHGNVLDMTTGGEIYLGHQASLELTDIVVRGIGTDKGTITFQDDTSTLSTSNVYFDFDTDFSMTVGKLYVDGPTTISGFFSSSRTIDLRNDLFLSGNVTLSCGQGISGNGNTINLQGNLDVQADTPLHFISDTLVDGHGNTINLQDNAQLFVDTNVSVTLRNVNVKNSKNYLSASPIRLAATTSRLALDNAELNFVNDFYFDRGQIYFYNDVEFTSTNAFIYRSTVPSYIKSGANLKFNPNSTFDFRPSTIGQPGLLAKDLLMMDDSSARITFDGCSIKSTFTGFNLTKGSVFFDNKVSMTSAAALDISSTPVDPSAGSVLTDMDPASATWSPDGRFISVVCFFSDTLKVFSFSGSGNPSLVGSVPTGLDPDSVTWSPDGRFISVVNYGSDTLKVFSFSGSGNPSLVGSVLTGSGPETVVWSPDGRYISVVNVVSGTLQVFSFSGSGNPSLVGSVLTGSSPNSVDWSPDGRYISVVNVASDTLQVFSFSGSGNPSLVGSVSTGSSPTSVDWSPDGRFIAVIYYAYDTLQVFSFSGGTPSLVGSVSTGSRPHSVDWSPDGRYISVVNNGSDTLEVFSFSGSGNPSLVGFVFTGSRPYSVDWSPDGRFISVVNYGSDTLQVFTVNYINSSQAQAFSNSIVLGNSSLGADYDVNLKLLSGAYVEIDGLFNYDNTLGLTPFSNDNAKFVLKDSNSSIRLNPTNVFGWKDRSLLKNITGAGMGDYNLLNYDQNLDKIITHTESSVDFIYNNSNAIVNLEFSVNNNSNAILYLGEKIRYNSNAILNLEPQIENNSNAILDIDPQIKENSDAILHLEPQVEQNSNAIINLEPQIKDNSNAILNLGLQVKYNSNVIKTIEPFVRWNSNAIESEAEIEDFVRWNSNAILSLESQVENNSNAILWQDAQIRFNSDVIASALSEVNYIRWNSNAFVSAVKIYDTYQTYDADTTIENLVLYKKGFLIKYGKALTLSTPLPMGGHLDLLGTLSFASDLYLDSGVTFSSGGYIDGNDYALHLGSNITISQDTVVHFSGNTIIEGHGNTINLEDNAQLFVDTNVSVTLRNVNVKNSKNYLSASPIKLAAKGSRLILDNAKLNFVDDFYFDNGQIYFYNDVEFTGTSSFIYRSTVPSHIKSGANLKFNPNSIFDFRPSTTGEPGLLAKDLLMMDDENAKITFDGCSIKSTFTGFNLTKGSVFFDNKVSMTSAAALDISSTPADPSAGSASTGSVPYSVDWSPDGRFMSVLNFDSNTLQVFSFSGSGNPLLVGSASTGSNSYSVSWSSDGRFISVVSSASNILQVFSFSGSGNPLLVGSVSTSTTPFSVDWSPDGRFISVVHYNSSRLKVFSFSGSGSPSLVGSVATGTVPVSVSWSPDGRFISVVSAISTLQVFSFSGSGNPSLVGSVPTDSSPFSVDWSPDGRFISVINWGSDTLQVFSFSGSGNPSLVGSVSTGSDPRSVDWSPDGRFISVVNEASDTLQVFSFSGGNPSLIGSVSTGSGPYSVGWSVDGRFISVVNSVSDTLQVFTVNYINSSQTQSIYNSIVFGNSALGSNYDVNLRLLSGAFVEVDGILNIDNTQTTSIFDNDVSKFILKDSNSKIALAASNVNGFIDRSIMKQTQGRGFGDYNLLNYDTNADDIISYDEAPADLLISNSNAIVSLDSQIKDNSNAILNIIAFENDIIANSNAIVSLEDGRVGRFLSVNDGILYAIGSIVGDTTINERGILSGSINLNGGTLTNGGDILFSSGTTIESSGNLNPIGNTYILGGDITLPENVDLKFTTSGIIDGQGHSWIFGHNSRIKFDEYITVTFRNIKLNNVRNHSDGNASITVLNPWRSKLVLQNSELNLSDNFSFTSGELFLHGDVKISGTTQFNYTSTSAARIADFSQWYFDQGVTFSYGPLSDNRDLIIMQDSTSVIYLNGCTLKSTTTGLRLINGKLIIDGRVIAYNQDDKNGVATSLSQAISFGDGVNDLNVEIMPAANIEMISGILDVN